MWSSSKIIIDTIFGSVYASNTNIKKQHETCRFLFFHPELLVPPPPGLSVPNHLLHFVSGQEYFNFVHPVSFGHRSTCPITSEDQSLFITLNLIQALRLFDPEDIGGAIVQPEARDPGAPNLTSRRGVWSLVTDSSAPTSRRHTLLSHPALLASPPPGLPMLPHIPRSFPGQEPISANAYSIQVLEPNVSDCQLARSSEDQKLFMLPVIGGSRRADNEFFEEMEPSSLSPTFSDFGLQYCRDIDALPILPSRRGVLDMPIRSVIPTDPVYSSVGAASGLSSLLHHPALLSPPPPGLQMPSYILNFFVRKNSLLKASPVHRYWSGLVVEPFSSTGHKSLSCLSVPQAEASAYTRETVEKNPFTEFGVVKESADRSMQSNTDQICSISLTESLLDVAVLHSSIVVQDSTLTEIIVPQENWSSLVPGEASTLTATWFESNMPVFVGNEIECTRADHDDSICSTESLGDELLSEAVIVLPKGGHLQEGDPNRPRNPLYRTQDLVGLLSDLAVHEKPSSTQITAADYANTDEEYHAVLERFQCQKKENETSDLWRKILNEEVDEYSHSLTTTTTPPVTLEELIMLSKGLWTSNTLDAVLERLSSRYQIHVASEVFTLDSYDRLCDGHYDNMHSANLINVYNFHPFRIGNQLGLVTVEFQKRQMTIYEGRNLDQKEITAPIVAYYDAVCMRNNIKKANWAIGYGSFDDDIAEPMAPSHKIVCIVYQLITRARDRSAQIILEIAIGMLMEGSTLNERPRGETRFVAGGICLDGEDLHSLRPRQPLTDNVVAAFMNLLEARSNASQSTSKPLLDFKYLPVAYFEFLNSESMWEIVLNWTESIEDFLLSMFLLPVCCHSHWTLMCLDIEDASITIFDSSNVAQVKPNYIPKVLRWLTQEDKRRGRLNATWTIHMATVPQQQPQSNDCGLYVLSYAEGLTRGRIIKTVDTNRRKLMESLQKGEIPLGND